MKFLHNSLSINIIYVIRTFNAKFQYRLAVVWTFIFFLIWLLTFVLTYSAQGASLYFLVLFNVAAFNGLYWQLNHLLNLQKNIAFRLDKINNNRPRFRRKSFRAIRSNSNQKDNMIVEQPFDVWMGICTFIIFIAISLILCWIHIIFYHGIVNVFQFAIIEKLIKHFETPIIVILFISTIATMMILGSIRRLNSITSIMWMLMHGLLNSISILHLYPNLPNVNNCINQSIDVGDEYTKTIVCLQLSQYWFDKWLSSIFAFTAIFGGALLAFYSIDHKKFGWSSNEKQYHNLSFLFAVSAILIIFSNIIMIGFPMMLDILAIEKF